MFATVSLNSILVHHPCKSGLDAFTAKFGHLDPDTPIPLLACLESNSVFDVLWALRAVHQDISSVIPLIAADFAESVLHIFEEKFPEDDRPRKAIEAARGGGSRRASTDAAHAAAHAAAYAAHAAAYAAHAAAFSAYAATGARAAAFAVADAATDAASRDASAAHVSASRAAERTKQAEILRKYFSNVQD